MTMPTASTRPGSISAAYRRARAAEGRLLDDALVARLPILPAAHPWAGEWALRGPDCRPASWPGSPGRRPREPPGPGLRNRLADRAVAGVPGTRAIGVDIEGPELEQARRVFAGRAATVFLAGDAATIDAAPLAPDVIVLASVIQYLPDPAERRRAAARGLPSGRLAPRPRQPALRPGRGPRGRRPDGCPLRGRRRARAGRRLPPPHARVLRERWGR